jgi:nucleotide-binding universal stress UspA family protein
LVPPFPRLRPVPAPEGTHESGDMTTRDPDPRLPANAVVVGFDRTAVSSRALEWAADHAAREGRPLVIAHAVEPVGTMGTTWLNLVDPATEPTPAEMGRKGDELLATAIARVAARHPALTTVPLVTLENPAAELVHLSRSAELVVVGSRGHGVSRSVPTGQVGSWLARRASCPVVAVPDFHPLIVRQGVLVGVPVTEDAAAVLDFACRYASVHRLPLHIVHATRETGGHVADDHRRWLAEALSGLQEHYPDVRVQSALTPGRPAATLLRMADRMNLLVVGRHHAIGLHQSPFGHVRSSVVDRSPCPTAVVPAHVPEPA